MPIIVAIVAIAPLFVGRQIGRTTIEKDLAAWEKMPDSPTRERLLKSIEQRVDAMIIQKWGTAVRAFLVIGLIAMAVGVLRLWRSDWQFDDFASFSLLYGTGLAALACNGAYAQGIRIKARQAAADAEELRGASGPPDQQSGRVPQESPESSQQPAVSQLASRDALQPQP